MVQRLADWTKIWNFLKGESLVGQATRAVIYYVVILLVVDLLEFVNHEVWALVTVFLLLLSVGDMYKNSEASLRFLAKRLPSALATTLVAYALSQWLDYLFGVLFFVFLFYQIVERYAPD
jgi:hypothetical protein